MKPKTPSQKKAYDALNTRLAKYMAQVQGIYDDICLRLANAVSLTDYDGVVEFLFKNYPELASLIGQLMADYAALWLNGHMVWATHGHVYNMDNHPPFQKGDILLHGHTHIPAAQQFEDGYYYINPGSVSIKAIEDGSVISSFTVE